MLGNLFPIMDRFVSISREALAELLKASGSLLTPEDYLASLSQTDGFEKYSSRTTAAVWSKYFLLIAAIVSGLWTCMPFGFSLESVIVTAVLAAITYYEFRVYSAFRNRDLQAPTLGFRNQSAFAAFILIYCLYHSVVPLQVPDHYREYMDPDMSQMVRTLTVVTYLTVGVIGGISQFCLAWYYRAARVRQMSE